MALYSGTECVFSHGASCVFHIQLGRDRDSVPLTRDYLGPAKDALRAREREVLERVIASGPEALSGD